jgi:hypothetical protein
MLTPDREGERSDRSKSWIDIEWSEPKPQAVDDRSAVQAFMDRLRQALKALEQQPKK